MCRLRLASLFCCGCMLLLIFIFTWNPLKEKIPGEQVSRGLLSWDCEKLFQFIPTEKLLLSTGAGWRILEKSSLDCCGDGHGLNFFEQQWRWSTFHLHYQNHMHQVHVQSCDRWCFLFHIYFRCFLLHSFRTVVFLAEWFVTFSFAHNSANGDFFSFCSTLCLLYWPSWLDFYTKH